jgi:ribonuclease HI|tara:strand:- start:37644 stop:38078 length:435 start_codon:yes stop_codon:yes gene_type:complete
MSIRVYTDGACRGNPGPGGWGAIIFRDNEEIELFDGDKITTNNQMEMMAAIKALEYLKDEDQKILLYTDSDYLRQGITSWILKWKNNNWRTAAKKAVKNKELWILLDKLVQELNIEWHWVKGHSGDPGNEKADDLANKGADLAC